MTTSGDPSWRPDRAGERSSHRTDEAGAQDRTQELHGGPSWGPVDEPAGVPESTGAGYQAGSTPGYLQPSAGRLGKEPVPGAYLPSGERRYSSVLPALAAGLVAAGLTIVLGQSAESLSRSGNRWISALGVVAGYFDARRFTVLGKLDTGAEVAAAAVVGLGTLVLILLATLGAGRVAARGLLFFAAWGTVAISAGAAAVIGGWVSGSVRLEPFSMMTGVMYGAAWGVLFGWLPALAAVLLRIGRRR